MSVAELAFPDIQRMIQEALKNVMPGQVPAFAKGVVEAPEKGWCKALYYDALTGMQFSFYDVPTVVAVALVREGLSRLVTAPTIVIPTVQMADVPPIKYEKIELPTVPEIELPPLELPEAPTIEVPWVEWPTPTEITIPKPLIPYCNESFPAFVTDFAPLMPIVNALNVQREMLYKIQGSPVPESPNYGGINLAVFFVNEGLKAAYETVEKVIVEINDLRNKTQAALNSLGGRIKESVDAGLADIKDKTQESLNAFRGSVQGSVSGAIGDYSVKVQSAFYKYQTDMHTKTVNALKDFRQKTQDALNAYRASIEVSVNAGLSQFIPALYDMIGLPVPEVSEADRQALRDMGDVNGDGVIDGKDLDLIKRLFGKSRGETGYVEACDLNHDGVIDVSDLSIASRNYGKAVVSSTQLISPAQVRNVGKDGFEFYGLSSGMKLAYVAIGRKG